MSSPIKSVFLDRDGVLNEEVGHLSRTQDLRLLPGAAEAINRLNKLHIPVIVVTNQSVVARGICTEEQVDEIHAYLAGLLFKDGATINRFHYCPHHPTEGIGEYRIACRCRKPNPGMLLEAAEKLNLDLNSSVIVGDQVTDLEAGWEAGCRAVLVSTGHGRKTRERMRPTSRQPDYFAEDLPDAVDWILRDSGNG